MKEERKLSLFVLALKSHENYAKEVEIGNGIDRHLLGLKSMLDVDQSHLLFSDEIFLRSQTWKLSTSSLGKRNQLQGKYKIKIVCGFGAVVEDGYGINYLTLDDSFNFCIESKLSCSETCSSTFVTAIEWALDAIADLVRSAKIPSNKL